MGVPKWFSEAMHKGLTTPEWGSGSGWDKLPLKEVSPTFGEQPWTLVMMVTPWGQLDYYRKEKIQGERTGCVRPQETWISAWVVRLNSWWQEEVSSWHLPPKAFLHPGVLCTVYEKRELGKWKNKINIQQIRGTQSVPYWRHSSPIPRKRLCEQGQLKHSLNTYCVCVCVRVFVRARVAAMCW